jgi:hypothetical protein
MGGGSFHIRVAGGEQKQRRDGGDPQHDILPGCIA